MKKHVFYFNLLKMQAMKGMRIWLVMVGLVCAVGAWGQGWMKVYGESEPLGAASLSAFPKLVKTADGNYLIMGFKYAVDGFTPDSVALVKANENGDLIWRKTIQHINDWYPCGIVQAPDGGFVIGGNGGGLNNTLDSVFFTKLNADGVKVWQKSFKAPQSTDGVVTNAISSIPSGGYIIVGSTTTGASTREFALRIDEAGNQLWSKTYGSNNTIEYFTDVAPTIDGNFIMIQRESGSASNAHLTKIGPNGVLLWSNSIAGLAEKVVPLPDGNFFVAGPYIGLYSETGIKIWGKASSFHATDAVSLENGGLLLAGGVAASDVILQKLSPAGQEVWIKYFGSPNIQEKAGSLLNNTDGTVVVSGHKFNTEGKKAGLLLIKTDANGNLYTSALTGTVHQDPQSDCLPDPNEPGLSNWLVQAAGNQLFATLTDSLGQFTLPVDTGSYEVTITPPGPYWETCNSPTTISITEFYDTLSLDFPAQAIADCPYLTVDISAPFLRRCFDNNYYVHYCNDGTTTAEAATVEVTLDPYLTYVSSTLPLASQNGNVLTFDLGDVAVGDCGSFQITAHLDCDSTILGQTHCTSAHISPDSLCLQPDPLWDGSSIEVDAACNGDSITFTITNVGANGMPAPLGYIIIEDQIVLLTNDFQLNAGESTIVTVPANGSTFHLEAQQAAAHPSGFASTGSTIEGCGGWLSLGFFTQWSFDDDPDPFTDVDCQANIGSYDPNDKQGFPAGLGEEHLIEPGQDIEYLIRFQNTGTDTAFKVTVVDVLPPELDLATVRPGASSHPYTHGVTPEGWLTFTFDNIQLPDSTTNEAASHGFVRFRASQRPGLGWSNVIANTALIYFDFNAPEQTNTFKHRIGQVFPWTLVGTEPPIFQPKTNVRIVPNPLTDSALLQVEGIEPGPLRLMLTDIAGKPLRQLSTNGTSFEFQRGELPTGVYFFQIERNGERLASGKLMVR